MVVFNGSGAGPVPLTRVGYLKSSRPERNVQDVAAPVARFARAEFPPETPIVRSQLVGVGTILAGTQPEIPIQRLRRILGRAEIGVHAAFAVDPRVDLGHRADRAAFDQFDAVAQALQRVTLVAELRGQLVLGGQLGQRADFPHVVRQRFFQIEMLLPRQRPIGRMKVRVVGRADGDRVDLLFHLVEHLAEVGVDLGLGIIAEGLFASFLIDFDERDQVLRFQAADARGALAAGTDHGYVQRVVGRLSPRFIATRIDEEPCADGGRRGQKRTTRMTNGHDDDPFVGRRERTTTPGGKTSGLPL
ncbi:MAG: hypothetical protein QM811_24385 [Pirellulales bacterium]